MNVCYVSSILNIHDLRFFKKFAEKGYEVNVVSFAEHNPKLNQNMTLYHFSLRSLLDIPKAVTFLKKILRKIEPDVLHGGFIQMDGFICALSGFHPFVLMPWGSDVLLFPRGSILMRAIAMYTISKADMITCDAEFVKSEILRIGRCGAQRVITFPWGVDLKKFQPNVDGSKIRRRIGWEDKRIIVVTRNFEPKYGIELFLRTLPRMVKEVPDVGVLFCGKGPLMDQFTRFVNNHGLKEYVFFAGFIENDELPKYLRAADIYVSTSITDGTSVSLLEAMACGLPVVVTDNPSILEWIKDGENGFVVPRNNLSQLTEKLIHLLKDDTLMKQFGERNLEIAKARADWDKNFERLEHTYEIARRLN